MCVCVSAANRRHVGRIVVSGRRRRCSGRTGGDYSGLFNVSSLNSHHITSHVNVSRFNS